MSKSNTRQRFLLPSAEKGENGLARLYLPTRRQWTLGGVHARSLVSRVLRVFVLLSICLSVFPTGRSVLDEESLSVLGCITVHQIGAVERS